MANQAEELVDGTDISTELAEAIEDVSDHCKQGFAYLDDEDIPQADRDKLAETLENHGLHAYRYEEMDDGSVVALYANDAEGNVKFKAFDNLTEASVWSPRDERGEA